MSDDISSFVVNQFLLKEEKIRRRKERLVQVRQQSKVVALKIRQAVSDAKKRQLEFVLEQLKRKVDDDYQSQLETYQDQYSECLKQLGFGHDTSVVDQLQKYREQKEVLDAEISAIRGQIVMTEIEKKKSIQEIRVDRMIQQRNQNIEMEKQRAAKIASLPPHLPDPVDNLETNSASRFSTRNVTVRSKKSSRPLTCLQEYSDSVDEEESLSDKPISSCRGLQRDQFRKPFFPKILDTSETADNKENLEDRDYHQEIYSKSKVNFEKDLNLERPSVFDPCLCCNTSNQKKVCEHIIHPRSESRLQREIAFKNSQQKKSRDSKGRIGYVTSFKNRRFSRGNRSRSRLSGKHSLQKADLEEYYPSNKTMFADPNLEDRALPPDKNNAVVTSQSYVGSCSSNPEVQVERASTINAGKSAYTLAKELKVMEENRRLLKNLHDESESLKVQERYSAAQEKLNLQKEHENYIKEMEALEKAEKAKKLKEFCSRVQQRSASTRHEAVVNHEKNSIGDSYSTENASQEALHFEEECKSDSSTYFDSNSTDTLQQENSSKEDNIINGSKDESSIYSPADDMMNIAQLSFDQEMSTPEEIGNNSDSWKPTEEKKLYFPPLRCDDSNHFQKSNVNRSIPLQTVQKDMSGIYARQLYSKQQLERIRENKMTLQNKLEIKCLADEHQILHKCSKFNVQQNSKICPEDCHKIGTTIIHDISCSNSVGSSLSTASSDDTICHCKQVHFKENNSTPNKSSSETMSSDETLSSKNVKDVEKLPECSERDLKLRRLLATIITHRGLPLPSESNSKSDSTQTPHSSPTSVRPAFMKTYVQLPSHINNPAESVMAEVQKEYPEILPPSVSENSSNSDEDIVCSVSFSETNSSVTNLKAKEEQYIEKEDNISICKASLQHISQQQKEIQDHLNKVWEQQQQQLQNSEKNFITIQKQLSSERPSKDSNLDIEIARHSSTSSSSLHVSPISVNTVLQSSSETIKALSLSNFNPSSGCTSEIESCVKVTPKLTDKPLDNLKSEANENISVRENFAFNCSLLTGGNENLSPMNHSWSNLQNLGENSPVIEDEVRNSYVPISPKFGKVNSPDKVDSPSCELEEEWLSELRCIINDHVASQSSVRQEAHNGRYYFGLSWLRKPPVTFGGRVTNLQPHELSTIVEMDSPNTSSQSLGKNLSVIDKAKYVCSEEINKLPETVPVFKSMSSDLSYTNEDLTSEKLNSSPLFQKALSLNNGCGQQASLKGYSSSEECMEKRSKSSSTSVYPLSTSSSSSDKADENIQDLNNQILEKSFPESNLVPTDNTTVSCSLNLKKMMDPNFFVSSLQHPASETSAEIQSKWEWPLQGKGISDESALTLVSLEDSFDNPNTSTPHDTPKKGFDKFSPSPSTKEFKTEETGRCLTPILHSPLTPNLPSEVSASESLLSFQRHELSAFESDKDEDEVLKKKASQNIAVSHPIEDKENQLLPKDSQVLATTPYTSPLHKKVEDIKCINLPSQSKSSSPTFSPLSATKQKAFSKSVSPTLQTNIGASTPSPKPLELRRVLQAWKNSRTLSDY